MFGNPSTSIDFAQFLTDTRIKSPHAICTSGGRAHKHINTHTHTDPCNRYGSSVCMRQMCTLTQTRRRLRRQIVALNSIRCQLYATANNINASHSDCGGGDNNRPLCRAKVHGIVRGSSSRIVRDLCIVHLNAAAPPRRQKNALALSSNRWFAFEQKLKSGTTSNPHSFQMDGWLLFPRVLNGNHNVTAESRHQIVRIDCDVCVLFAECIV